MRLTANLPKISNATNSSKNIVKNRLVLLRRKNPETPISKTNIKYSVVKEMF
jgi:hypothetical protein